MKVAGCNRESGEPHRFAYSRQLQIAVRVRGKGFKSAHARAGVAKIVGIDRELWMERCSGISTDEASRIPECKGFEENAFEHANNSACRSDAKSQREYDNPGKG